ARGRPRIPALHAARRFPRLARARRPPLGRSREDRGVAAPAESSADRRLRHDTDMDQSDGAGAVRNPYEVLGVSPDASSEEIRDAYWRLVRFHRTEGEAAWMPTHLGEIQAAYDVLSDPARRAELDAANGAHEQPRPAPYQPGLPPYEHGPRPYEPGTHQPGAQPSPPPERPKPVHHS